MDCHVGRHPATALVPTLTSISNSPRFALEYVPTCDLHFPKLLHGVETSGGPRTVQLGSLPDPVDDGARDYVVDCRKKKCVARGRGDWHAHVNDSVYLAEPHEVAELEGGLS